MSEKYASGVIRGFGKLLRTFGGQQAPSEVDLGPLQSVVDVSEMATYGYSPGLDDGWWLGRFDLQLTGVGFQTGTWDPRDVAGSPVLDQSDLVPWVYSVGLKVTAVANLSDFKDSHVWLRGYGNVLGSGAAITNPIAFFLAGDVYRSSALLGEVMNRFYIKGPPVRVPREGALYFAVENDGALGNVQYAYSMLMRFLPEGIQPR